MDIWDTMMTPVWDYMHLDINPPWWQWHADARNNLKLVSIMSTKQSIIWGSTTEHQKTLWKLVAISFEHHWAFIQHNKTALYLQREAKSSSGWPDVHVFHPLCELTAGSIKELQSLEGSFALTTLACPCIHDRQNRMIWTLQIHILPVDMCKLQTSKLENLDVQIS